MKLVRKLVAGFGRLWRKVLVPDFLLGREKAVAAFLTPIVVAQVLPLIGVDVPGSLVEQLLLAVVTSVTVHTTSNTGG